MRFFKPEYKSLRKRKWFALLPVTIGKETRWLEKVEVEQIYLDKISPSGEPEPAWHNTSFKN